ncbi:MAG: threonine--tRNA ligase [Candidatus Woesebacteria bacterium]|nr:MAG: threonine--tRNA ligase [Candidatus Woesebacteria bacterium]
MSKEEQALWSLRHTAEHVLHTAMQNLYPKLKKAMGPATPEGFYFDFDSDDKISEEDFSKIEKEMQKLIDQDLPMAQEDISVEKAREIFKNNPYKLEWIDEIEKRGEKVSIYKMGEIDLDLCSGPHVESTGKLKAFKLLSVAGAYWHGDEKNKMLQRIYGTVFPSQKELDDYLKNLELAKLHDHRKLGKELELFSISDDVGQGLILWLPKGNIIKEEVENWAKQTEKEWGYQRVTTPNITKSGLYYTSGHLPYYKADMYPPMTLDDGQEYYLKPMNCPHHHMIYKSKPRSYKDLPLRLAEYGTCYRYEASGELFGLMRVRGFAQNDSHIYCTDEQAVEEFVQVMKLHEFYYKSLGIKDYYLELALRDPADTKKYHGNEEMWIHAEKLMREAVKRVDIPMVEKVGSAAFYGPKIDFIIKTSIGREFAISTNQIDLYMGERFGLKYVDKDGTEKTPVIIHRAPLGSHERFIGFLIEHFGGNFPTWLTPVQVKILPITEKHLDYAMKVKSALEQEGIRVEVDTRNERLQAKIRDAQMEKVSYMFIVGDREAEAKAVAVRRRDGTDLGSQNLEDFIKTLKKEIEEKKIN